MNDNSHSQAREGAGSAPSGTSSGGAPEQPASDTGIYGSDPMIEVARDNVQYTLLGTAHVSRSSAETVSRMLAGEDFDAVAVELCPARYSALTEPEDYRQMDLFAVIRQGKAPLIAANLAMSAYQKRIAEQFGIEPGAEMKAAIDAARDREPELPVMLVDRDVGVTLKRTYRGVGLWQRWMLLTGLAMSVFTREEITEEDIEKLKQGDILESTFSEFAQHSESLYQSLIAERDLYMAARLREEAALQHHDRVLVVVGAGHLKGLAQALKDQHEPAREVRQKLETTPTGSRWLRYVPWVVVALVLTGFGIGFYRSPALGWELVLNWVLINGVLCAAGAVIARVHPLTILASLLAAPLTSLNPTIGAGMVAAGVELYLRKPRVGDFHSLRDDVTQVSGWWSNRVARTLLVFLFTNLGSMAGTWLAGFRILERLA